MFKDYFLNRTLKRLENEGNNDLLQIMEFGPQPYSTNELKLLLGRLRRETREVIRLQKNFFLAGASSVILTGISFLCAALNLKLLGMIFLLLAPVGLLTFAAGSVYVYQRYRSFRHSKVLARVIREEIDRRHKDASIF